MLDRTDKADETPLTICDLTQSWSETGGGIGTYIRRKRRYILEQTPFRHLLIVPGEEDSVRIDGRSIHCTVKSPLVPKRTNYRLLLRNKKVRELLERFQPDVIECQDAYNLPWAALRHARQHPGTATVGGYCTDFPTVYVGETLEGWGYPKIARWARDRAYAYCRKLYSRFDAVYAMSVHGGGAKLKALGIDPVHNMHRGVHLTSFKPERRDPLLREDLGVAPDAPLLIYVGRLDGEKGADVVGNAFRRLPEELGAHLLLLGHGPMREELAASHPRIHAPGFVSDRDLLARWLASADLYVSGMAFETFGISIIEAQASGLPVVGVSAGAMIDRVPEGAGLLVEPGDDVAMAKAIEKVLGGDMAAMSAKARTLAEPYSWANAMERLFGAIYPAALAEAGKRAEAAGKIDAAQEARLASQAISS
ncbi:glycosyltransferase [Sphingomicrobium sediminis]|uniref:Glycosyltransferase n=1 Tax=Sphingomicrobium sediminis TaxID=2950949 RepID=A0A9X2EL17_9SPHN|nr:glycosyltransferase [Sphingomicrobium sediminis]MCM8557372.1 glycosyltransferase [Sphingomicrobium sediminis]